MLCLLLSRFKREEIKIQAWEEHQKAQIEAEMRKIEVSRLFLEFFLASLYHSICKMHMHTTIPSWEACSVVD